jgi:hypothetical protein
VRAHWLSEHHVRENAPVRSAAGNFFALVFFLWRGLSLNPRAVPSPLIGKPVPAFTSGIDGFQWLNRAGREGD